MPRFYVELPLARGTELSLPPTAARHVQVLRLQPGRTIALFDGGGEDWSAEITRIGRAEVQVRIGEPTPVDRELPLAVTLAVGMPANERMDWLVEKATELGASAIQPLVCERSTLRLQGERADRKLAHWRGIAAAAAEQCGRARLPLIHPVRSFAEWHRTLPTGAREARFVLSLGADREPFAELLCPAVREGLPLSLLSGPEGGLSPAEDASARAAGWQAVTLGARVLRAETAPLAALAMVASVCA